MLKWTVEECNGGESYVGWLGLCPVISIFRNPLLPEGHLGVFCRLPGWNITEAQGGLKEAKRYCELQVAAWVAKAGLKPQEGQE